MAVALRLVSHLPLEDKISKQQLRLVENNKLSLRRHSFPVFSAQRMENHSMKTPKKPLFGLAVVLVVGAIQLAAADSAADLAAIHAVDDVWLKSFNTRDADTMAAQYDEHAVLLPPDAPAVHGQAAIRAFFANMMPGATKDGLEFTLSSKPAGGARGDMGWSSGTYTLKDKTGHVIDTGKYLSVSRKKDGKWLYIRDTWNSDGPPASKESAVPPKK
jgi:uncharacterized protein (TIGR02246 family)